MQGNGYNRATLAAELGCTIDDLKAITKNEISGDAYVERMQALMSQPRSAIGDKNAADTAPRPAGLTAIGAASIPRDTDEKTPPAGATVIKPLTAAEAAAGASKLSHLFHDMFNSMDNLLKFAAPIYVVDPATNETKKMDPRIWATVSLAECDRLAAIIADIGRHNVIVAQAVRYANTTDDARFVLQLVTPRMLATGTYVQGSMQQQNERKKTNRK